MLDLNSLNPHPNRATLSWKEVILQKSHRQTPTKISHKFQQKKGRLAPTVGGVRDFFVCIKNKNKGGIHSLLIYITSYCVKTSSKQRRNPRLTLLTKVGGTKTTCSKGRSSSTKYIIKFWISSWNPPLKRKSSVDGSEIRRSPPGMVPKPVQLMGFQLPTSTGDRRISEPSTV